MACFDSDSELREYKQHVKLTYVLEQHVTVTQVQWQSTIKNFHSFSNACEKHVTITQVPG